MKITYDHDNKCEVQTCGVCGHTYHYYWDYDKQHENEEKPFVQLEEPLLHTVRRSWEPVRVEKITQYACPVCGVLQVDIESF